MLICRWGYVVVRFSVLSGVQCNLELRSDGWSCGVVSGLNVLVWQFWIQFIIIIIFPVNPLI